jgi:hypothetical protein
MTQAKKFSSGVANSLKEFPIGCAQRRKKRFYRIKITESLILFLINDGGPPGE